MHRVITLVMMGALSAAGLRAQTPDLDLQPGRNFPMAVNAFGTGRTEALAVGDVDNDGDFDLEVVIANLLGTNYLTFSDLDDGMDPALELPANGNSNQSIDVDVFDGDPDFALSNDANQSNRYYKNVLGVPLFQVAETLAPGAGTRFTLRDAAPNAFAILFLALQSTPTSFKQGTLHSFPVSAFLNRNTDAGGLDAVDFAWPDTSVFPSCLKIWMQYGVQDASVLGAGASLSNAVRLKVPFWRRAARRRACRIQRGAASRVGSNREVGS